MDITQERWPKFWESSAVTKAVGISQIHLNKLIERKQHGIKASFQAGRGRGSRRFFSKDDVFGVALVWWLFEGGLRSGAIEVVLKQICARQGDSKARDAARILIKREVEMLVVQREPRVAGGASRDHTRQRVFLGERLHASRLIDETKTEVMLVIPVGSFFADLKKSLQKVGASLELPNEAL